MRVIDLLNKIANGKEVPKKIRVYGDIFVFDDSNKIYEHEETRTNLLSIYNGNILNYEVEVIQEKEETKPITKEIEALGYACGEIQKCFISGWEKSLKNKSLNEEDKKIERIDEITFRSSTDNIKEEVLLYKINEIIKYISKEK